MKNTKFYLKVTLFSLRVSVFWIMLLIFNLLQVFLFLNGAQCEGINPEDLPTYPSQMSTKESNDLSSSMHNSVSAMKNILKDNYVAPVTAFSVAAGTAKVLTTIPNGSRAKVVISTITTLGGISLLSQGIATLNSRERINSSPKSSVSEEVNNLENSSDWFTNSPNEEVISLFSSIPGMEETMLGLLMISAGSIYLIWYLLVGHLVNLLDIEKLKSIQERPFFLKLVRKASRGRKLFTLPLLLILFLAQSYIFYGLLTLFNLGV